MIIKICRYCNSKVEGGVNEVQAGHNIREHEKWCKFNPKNKKKKEVKNEN